MVLDFMPSLATAMVAVAPADSSTSPASSVRFTGSCGAFTSRNVFLTAAHCVPRDEDLVVVPLAELGDTRRVVDRAYHPSSDLALLRTSPPERPGAEEALHNQLYRRYDIATLEDGAEFICAGFPAETSRDDGTEKPTARTVRGHFQRWFRYYHTDRGNYFAFEMSCPAPAGLSGSVVAYTRTPNVAIAVVSANHDSYALIDQVVEVDDHGRGYRERNSRVVSYGIAAGLFGHESWITETLSAWTDSDDLT